MLKIATKTKLNPEEAIKRAVMFFDLGAYRLRSKTSLPAALTLRGGGGGVKVTACIEEKGISVELESREWDYQVKEFIRKIH